MGVDRAGIARLVFQGPAAPLASYMPPGNKRWISAELRPVPRSVAAARALLQEAGFSWGQDGTLHDRESSVVEFSLLTNASNAARLKMAALLQEDLRELASLSTRPNDGSNSRPFSLIFRLKPAIRWQSNGSVKHCRIWAVSAECVTIHLPA